jgi:hypothetical protein
MLVLRPLTMTDRFTITGRLSLGDFIVGPHVRSLSLPNLRLTQLGDLRNPISWRTAAAASTAYRIRSGISFRPTRDAGR